MGVPAVLASNVADAANSLLVWYEAAINLLGTKEIEGSGSNRRILKWAQDLDIDYRDDDIPWCGLFMAHCVGSTLTDEELPAIPLMARQWRKFGESCHPMRGAVMVFWRGKKEGSLGHVGLYHSEDDASYHILGGNQNNSVNVARLSKDRFLEARWPTSAKLLTGTIVVAEAQGPMSPTEQ